MIMYTWKQFGNDFRNGDDAVFWDSNRPRDDNWTKIRPWLQGDKWKWRETNKKTWFSEICLKWWSDWTSTQSWQPINRSSVVYKPKWTVQEINDALWQQLFDATTIGSTYMTLANNPQYKITEENVTYLTGSWTRTENTYVLEIIEDWLYYIIVNGQFTMASWYNTTNSYQQKFRVGLFQYYEDGIYRPFDQTQNRGCWSADNWTLTNIQRLPAWSKFLPVFAHTYSWGAKIFSLFKAIKLW